jgi:hypothetical protein
VRFVNGDLTSIANNLRISHMKKISATLLFFISVYVCFSQAKENRVYIADPENIPCKIDFNPKTDLLQLVYAGKTIANIHIKAKGSVQFDQQVDTLGSNQALTQTIKFNGENLDFNGLVLASNEAIAAENSQKFQNIFPIVRTTIGNPSVNLRNNAVYDRHDDWMIEINTDNETLRITPKTQNDSNRTFEMSAKGGDKIEIIFRPLFYQKHKGIKYFEPQTYKVWKESVTGWSSWWAYMRNFNESDLKELLQVWDEKHFADYGYKYIQIDDVYQGGVDEGHRAPEKGPNGYYATGPKTWLQWKKDLFPSGLSGYVNSVKKAGFTPAIWVSTNFTASDSADKHPDWFIQGKDGKPSIAPWVAYAVNAKNTEAVENLIRPTFRGLKAAGIQYVKIDILRHYLYDNMHNNMEFFASNGYTPDDVFRAYLKVAREEMGDNSFILSCWGVLPQSVGLVNACRIGGDGYGPVTLQQYNSWNGIVWINDPDHCNVYPNFEPAETGNVTKVNQVKATPSETRLRPALASIAGSMLILSDKPDVYKNDDNLEGLRRAAPVLFSVPGQLYDFDPVKSSLVPGLDTLTIRSGANPSPIDADQFGKVCPWWLNEINRSFENWDVLSHMNWTKDTMSETNIKFENLGLDRNDEYLVFEFWNKQFLGIFKDSFQISSLAPKEIQTFSIRQKVGHPQIVSTNRHLSQGGCDLIDVTWNQNTLSGKSKVVKDDNYELYIYVPEGYSIKEATASNQEVKIIHNKLSLLSFTPKQSGEVSWKIVFAKKG